MARTPARRNLALPRPPEEYDQKDETENRRLIQEALSRPGASGAVTESDLTLSDNTTNDVTSTAHGLAPKSPGDATKFLNGAATPAYAAVKDSDLSTSDITTNDATDAKHGFLPKLSGNPDEFLNGEGDWAEPSGSSTVPDWVSDDARNTPGSPNALDDEFDGASGSAIAGAWTAVNAGTSTTSLDGKSRVVITAQAAAGDNKRMWVKTPPSTPWKITTRVALRNSAVQPFAGLVVRNSSSAKLIVLGIGIATTAWSGIRLGAYKFTNATTFSATILDQVLAAAYLPTYFQIENDGTNLKYKVSWIGTEDADWIQIGSETLATFISSVDQIGLVVDSNNGSVSGVGIFDFFRVT